jgi:phosphoglycolate phosphatase-like HAD superfamily hydrolase
MTRDRSAKTIALDADGVLLDYGHAYAGAWERAFGTKPALRNPNAYWPMDRWQVPRLAGAELEHFRAAFDEEFWSSIPAVDGALEGCQMLVDAGYDLICVTALDARNLKARERNLRDLGFPIFTVVATRMDVMNVSPKAETINSQDLAAFVDDFAPYFKGIIGPVHKALIVRDPDGSPNDGSHIALANSTHGNLLEFCQWWTAT